MCLTKWMSEKHGAWTFLWTTPGSHEASYSPSILSDGWKSMIPHDTIAIARPGTVPVLPELGWWKRSSNSAVLQEPSLISPCVPILFNVRPDVFHILPWCSILMFMFFPQPFLICPPSFLFCSCFHHDCPAAFWGFPAPGRWSSARGSDSRAIRRRNLWASAIG